MNRFLKIVILGFLLSLPWIGSASAQQVNLYCLVDTGPPLHWAPCSASNPMQISGSISASFASFHMTSALTPLGVTNSSQTSPAFTTGNNVVVTNVGTTNTMYCQPGATATTSSQPIAPNNGWFEFATTSETTIACITASSTTTANFAVGTGGAAGTGGGGGSSGGGNVNVTQWDTTSLGVPTAYGTAPTTGNYIGVNAFITNTVPVSVASGGLASGAGTDGWDSTQGAKADSACGTDNGNCSVAALLKRNNQNLTTLNGTAGAPAQLAVNVTPTDCSGTVATGGTAVNAFTAQTTLHGFTILNDDTSEPLWISFTTTAAASTAGSYPLAPATATSFAGASSYTTPPGFGTNHALSVVAATSAHKFSCTWW